MKIYQPYSMHELGQRKNQEDSIFPVKGAATANDSTFIVCDGMGGHERGEVASNTVCESFGTFMKDCDPETFDTEKFKEALAYVYSELARVGANTNMGTTLTFLHINSKGALVAHIGDSRVYHIRRGADGKMQIVHRTADHSFVGELVAAGVITEEEARRHPKKNIIVRAMQPGESSPADFYTTAEVCTDDYFFLCSDGVIESIVDDTLLEILSEDATDEAKMEMIREACLNSADNNSAYLVRVAEGIAPVPVAVPNVDVLTSTIPPKQQVAPSDVTAPKRPSEEPKMHTKPAPKAKSNVNMWLVAIIVALLALIVTYLVMNNKPKGDDADAVEDPIENKNDAVLDVETTPEEFTVPEVNPNEESEPTPSVKRGRTDKKKTDVTPRGEGTPNSNPVAPAATESAAEAETPPAAPAEPKGKSNEGTTAPAPQGSARTDSPEEVTRNAFGEQSGGENPLEAAGKGSNPGKTGDGAASDAESGDKASAPGKKTTEAPIEGATDI